MFTPSPAITQSDPMQELLGKVLGGYKPGQLGAAPTLGNEQGQQDYARQLAEALAQQQSAKSGLGMADRLSQAQYAPNSGALGALSMMAQAYAGKKLRGRELEAQSDAMAKAYSAKEGMGEQRAGSERSRRSMVAQQLELTKREAAEFIETGKIPEAKRDRLQALEGVNGPGIVNLDQGTVRYAQPEDAQPEGYKVTYAPGASAEDRAAVDAAARAAGWPSDPHGDVVDVGRVRPQPTGQFVTAAAAQRAQQNQRQTAQDVRAERADARDQARLESQQAAAQAAAADKAKAAQARQAASTSAAQELIDSIDRVTGSKGYGDLGTVWGDVKTHVPGVRNDAKDAQASLDNIGGQVALSTMATLKALSAQGATGFGALSKPELDLLKNSIAALQAGNLSHEALDANLKVVRSKMGMITSWQGDGQPSAPAAAPQPGHALKYNPQTGKIE